MMKQRKYLFSFTTRHHWRPFLPSSENANRKRWNQQHQTTVTPAPQRYMMKRLLLCLLLLTLHSCSSQTRFLQNWSQSQDWGLKSVANGDFYLVFRTRFWFDSLRWSQQGECLSEQALWSSDREQADFAQAGFLSVFVSGSFELVLFQIWSKQARRTIQEPGSHCKLSKRELTEIKLHSNMNIFVQQSSTFYYHFSLQKYTRELENFKFQRKPEVHLNSRHNCFTFTRVQSHRSHTWGWHYSQSHTTIRSLCLFQPGLISSKVK